MNLSFENAVALVTGARFRHRSRHSKSLRRDGRVVVLADSNEGSATHSWSMGGYTVETGALPGARRGCRRDVQNQGGEMEIKRSGSQPSGKGPADWFTGTVRIDPLFDAPDPARVAGASVTFEPGARTAWHTHPLGQMLIVTAGSGRVQRWGGPVEEVRPGDVVWFPPGEKHWHGASPTTALTHIAIQEKLDGKAVDWMEHVTGEQYESRSHENSRSS
jgi:quercetin dioxygenase-like cupin family protein